MSLRTVYHLNLDSALIEGATVALLPGDPGRGGGRAPPPAKGRAPPRPDETQLPAGVGRNPDTPRQG
jgi:hypothetical protein